MEQNSIDEWILLRSWSESQPISLVRVRQMSRGSFPAYLVCILRSARSACLLLCERRKCRIRWIYCFWSNGGGGKICYYMSPARRGDADRVWHLCEWSPPTEAVLGARKKFNRDARVLGLWRRGCHMSGGRFYDLRKNYDSLLPDLLRGHSSVRWSGGGGEKGGFAHLVSLA